MRQIQRRLEPALLGIPKHLNVYPTVGPANHPANCDGDNIEQRVLGILLTTWVGQIAKMATYTVCGLRGHRPLPF
jgi:hypothetical protein